MSNSKTVTDNSLKAQVSTLLSQVNAEEPEASLTLRKNVRLLYGKTIEAKLSRKASGAMAVDQVEARKRWTCSPGLSMKQATRLIQQVDQWVYDQVRTLPIHRGRVGEFETPSSRLPYVFYNGPRGDQGGVVKVYRVTAQQDSDLAEFEAKSRDCKLKDLSRGVYEAIQASEHFDHQQISFADVRGALTQDVLKYKRWPLQDRLHYY